jgi:hypothetical protein
MNWLLAIFVSFAALAAPTSALALERPAATVHYGTECPFYADGGSCATPEAGEIWLAPGASKFTLWHELGHIFDHDVLTDPQRAWFARLLGFKDVTWDQGTGPGTRGPSEVFADAFATCATERPVRRRGKWATTTNEVAYGWNYTPRQYRRVCTGIAVAQYLAKP